MPVILSGVTYLAEDVRAVVDLIAGDDVIAGDGVFLGGNVELTGGGSIVTTAAGNLILLPDTTGITIIGDARAPAFTAALNDNLFVSGELEVGGTSYFNTLVMGNNDQIYSNTTIGAILMRAANQTPDCPMLLTGSTVNHFILAERDDAIFDFAHPLQLDPTIFGHSRNQSTTQWWSETHNTVDAVKGIGSGSHVTHHEAPTELADDAEFDLPANSTGWGFVMAGDGEEYAQFSWTSAEVVTLIANSANVSAADVDGDLCIYDNTGKVSIRNRLGGAREIMFDYHYTT